MTPQYSISSLIFRMMMCFLLSGAAQAEDALPELSANRDRVLQKGLENLLQEHQLSEYVDRKKLALVVVDLSDRQHPRYSGVNEHHMMYAASLPKIAILVGAFVKIERGQLTLDDELWTDMNLMIRNSNNAAANRVLEKVGRYELLSILEEPKYHFYDRENGGGLWVGKAYSKPAAYQRDPLKGLSHAATAVQAARVYYLLANGQLLGPALSEKMLEVLSRPAINHKLVKGLKASYPESKIYRKSGTWRQFHSDSAMIEDKGHRYIIVGLVDHPDGGQWLVKLATPLMQLLEQSERPQNGD